MVGERYDAEVGPVAHGGHCVVRLPADAPGVGGTVVFVRHTLPGERVTVEITEGSVGDRFLRGDAVVVHEEAAGRVTPPCRYAGPGGCGGCDFQHVDLPTQRALKAQVVSEQLRRLAGLDRAVTVEPVPGDVDGLRWRTRMRYHRTEDGGLGLREHRSRRVVPVEDCLIQAPEAQVLVDGDPAPGAPVTELVHGHPFEVAPDGFWQVHRGAPETLVDAVLAVADLQPGDRVVELYAGVGLLSLFLAETVGPRGQVHAIEGDRAATELSGSNLAAYPWVTTTRGPVDQVLAGRLADSDVGDCDVVVLDPPRTGARRQVVEAVAELGPRTVVYLACDPAAFARDVSYFAASGYDLSGLRAFDLFPMTHRVELVGVLSKVT